MIKALHRNFFSYTVFLWNFTLLAMPHSYPDLFIKTNQPTQTPNLIRTNVIPRRKVWYNFLLLKGDQTGIACVLEQKCAVGL